MHASVLKMLRKFRAKWVKFGGRDTVLPVPAWVVKSMDSHQVFQFAGYLLEDARCLRTEDRRLRTHCYVRCVLGPVDIRGFPPARHCDSRSQLMEAILIRRELTKVQWERISNLVPGKKGDRGRAGEDNRLFVDAVLWILRTGAPWRDLPPALGQWNSVFVRFNRWSHKGVWERLFKALAEDPDFEHIMIDATIIRAHQHAAGAKGGLKIRPSVGRAAA
jgi:putative transposase